MSGAQTATLSRRPAVPTLARDYLTLTKPKVQSLLLFTTIATMYVAGDPSPGLVFLTCLGGALSAGGAGAINHAVDRDIDRTMARTADRPVASGRISAAAAVAFGLSLGTASFLLLSLTVNPLAAALSLSGFFGYVCVYTLWLKRTTPQNIVIGGGAGARPPPRPRGARTGGLRGRTSSPAPPPPPPRPWSPGLPLRAASAAWPSTCSRSYSSGPRPTSG